MIGVPFTSIMDDVITIGWFNLFSSKNCAGTLLASKYLNLNRTGVSLLIVLGMGTLNLVETGFNPCEALGFTSNLLLVPWSNSKVFNKV